MLTDAHAHLSIYEDSELGGVLDRAADGGVSVIITAAETWERSLRDVAIARSYGIVYAVIGIMPWHAYQVLDDSIFIKFQDLAKDPKVVGIGEIGLDFAWDHPLHKSPKEIQEHVFRKQVQLANSLGLPLVLHDKGAHRRVLEILKEEGGAKVGGVVHDFHADPETAEEYMDMGFLLSENGLLTYEAYHEVQKTITDIPLEFLLIETDCPFFTPKTKEGNKNEPAFVKFVAEKIAELKNTSAEYVAAVTADNLRRVFRLDA